MTAAPLTSSPSREAAQLRAAGAAGLAQGWLSWNSTPLSPSQVALGLMDVLGPQFPHVLNGRNGASSSGDCCEVEASSSV